MKTITIEVTQEDIEKGVRCNCNTCPVALAVSRSFRRAYVSAGPSVILIGDCITESNYIRANTPQEVNRFMRDFDLKRPVRPFTFQLEIPE